MDPLERGIRSQVAADQAYVERQLKQMQEKRSLVADGPPVGFGAKFEEEYQKQQEAVCQQFNLIPSDSYLLGTTFDSAWDRFKRENGVNRVCLTPAYESMTTTEEEPVWYGS